MHATPSRPIAPSAVIATERPQGAQAGYDLAERRLTAFVFYKTSGMPIERIPDHLRGIDFEQPVHATVVARRTPVAQHVRSARAVGDYFAAPGIDPSRLGINPTGRREQVLPVPTSVAALASTAAAVIDTWTQRGVPFQTVGGEPQLYSPALRSLLAAPAAAVA